MVAVGGEIHAARDAVKVHTYRLTAFSSRDSGKTWSAPVRVNNDPPGNGAFQFLTWMAVDQTDGSINIIFYDRRGQTGTKTGVTTAVSAIIAVAAIGTTGQSRRSSNLTSNLARQIFVRRPARSCPVTCRPKSTTSVAR